MKVPSKLRVFLWRLARQSLPTTDVLQHRNMAPQNACVVCGETDSWRHSLIECHHARSVWVLVPAEISDYVQHLHEPHVRGWLEAMLKDLSHEESTRVMITMWALGMPGARLFMKGSFRARFQCIASSKDLKRSFKLQSLLRGPRQRGRSAVRSGFLRLLAMSR
jgi:hypothetical protein